MPNTNSILKIFPFFLLLLACGNNKNKELIIGDWYGTEWNVNGKVSSLNEANTFFSFKNNGKYSLRFAGNAENGTYIVEKDNLFTRPYEQQEIMVRISKLTADSLVFDMNRGGEPETLTLLRK
jgi:hypothetical protein